MTEASFLPDRQGGGWLLLWDRKTEVEDGDPSASADPDVGIRSSGEASSRTDTRPVDLLLAGTRQTIHAKVLTPSDILRLEVDSPQPPSQTISGWLDLLRFSRELINRRRVRAAFPSPRGVPVARWRAVLDTQDRRLFLSLISRLPPAAFVTSGKWLDSDPRYQPETPWNTARAFLDTAVDTMMRAAGHALPSSAQFEALVERALAGPSGDFPSSSLTFRQEQSLKRWEQRQKDREFTPVRLVLQLQPPDSRRTTFRLAYFVESVELAEIESGDELASEVGIDSAGLIESEEGGRSPDLFSSLHPSIPTPGTATTSEGGDDPSPSNPTPDSTRQSRRPPILVPIGAVWREEVAAYVLSDRLDPIHRSLRSTLERVGRFLAPVEVSLASTAPEAALLTSDEAWDLVARHHSELTRAGARLELPPELNDLESRFPRSQVRLERADGLDPNLPILAPSYRVRWEVVSGGESLTAEDLRSLSRQAPLARRGDGWIAITAEAGERLAKVAEREVVEWTGPQALGAALAGEVRRAGDLADSRVIPEPGLETLLRELRQDVTELPPPLGLQATLRGYQRRGMSWLAHRTRLGLGALLADDMGLGKTIQVIALLLYLAEKKVPGGPTLVVCPASLVGNWERELTRFGPSLRLVRHHGNDRSRDASTLLERAKEHDVVLTTYGLVRRDQELLANVSWGTVILDEAQNIKNPTSAQARAVRGLRATRRLVLTGTPVENRLTELWSLADFANPGLLGPLDRFRRDIALPIERDRDARATRRLHAATSPFLLRRMKTDPAIVPELPEKEEFRVVCALTREQAQLYEEAVHESLGSVDDLEGIERNGRILKLLTSLKQICNHPAQYLHEEDGPLPGRSGKLERTAEIMDEIAASGEKALIFTQYVEMGTRLSSYLSRRLGEEVPLFHGGLSLQERDRMVSEFQSESGGPPALILSLRAGGVGLNLTRASHVIHYDRWWNPAVENQATDRAHRMGQQRRVQVHYLLTMGTLEERIDRLLEEKRALADSVVSGGEAWLTQLSTDQLRALVSLGSDAAVESLEIEEDDG